MSAANVSAASKALDSSARSQRRSFALDALRGYAMLTMILSGFMPGALPAWMHHAQVPPPDFQFNPNLPGITWVDLVFPFFLFSMGAAIPMALSRRIEQGVPYWKIVLSIFTRWALLIGFAMYCSRTQPFALGYKPIEVCYLLSILAFIFVFAILVRLPDSWSPVLKYGIKAAGWIGAIVFMALVKHGDGTTFVWNNMDIIIQILANVSVFGALVWLITQNNLLLRLGILGIFMAARLSSVEPGWVNWIFDKTTFSGLFGLGVQQYLHIIIPGTIIGDMILKWMKAPEEKVDPRKNWSSSRLVSMILLMLSFVVVMLVGLFCRSVWQTVVIGLALCLIGRFLFKNPNNSIEKLLKEFYSWGSYLLILGLIFEPYEGGIKKDSATMSYYYVSAGLAIFMLIGFTILIDLLKKKRWVQLLIDNGQNPMIGYIGRWGFIIPVLGLTRLNPLMDKLMVSPWAQFGHGVITTLIIFLFVSIFSKRKIFWRT